MGVKIKLDTFEGPLDLLLHLIERAEVDIWEVSISRITDQYMAVLREMQELELDVASDFLVMAATLLAIKSRMLLPRQEPEELGEEEAEEEIDPREQLIERLIEYKKYRKLAEVLGEREQERLQVYTRPPLDLSAYTKEENPLQGVRLEEMMELFIEAMKKSRREEPLAHVAREEISVSERMREIDRLAQDRDEPLFFSELIQGPSVTRELLITTFLALLELMKLRRILCRQDRLFDDIRIEGIGRKGEESDEWLVASGFD